MSRNRRLAAGVIALVIYFGIDLVPKWRPDLAASGAYLVYVLSVPVVLLGLVALLSWGVIARGRGPALSNRPRPVIGLSVTGLLLFGVSMGLARFVPGALPTGSYLLSFDPAVWKNPRSSEYVQGDITNRQKMLGSVVDRLNETQDRDEIETLLGPSLDTPYFKSSHRDLIYSLGPERDSFTTIDSEWLLIWLDDSNHFERYAILTD